MKSGLAQSGGEEDEFIVSNNWPFDRNAEADNNLFFGMLMEIGISSTAAQVEVRANSYFSVA